MVESLPKLNVAKLLNKARLAQDGSCESGAMRVVGI